MIELKKEILNYGISNSDEEWKYLSTFVYKKTAKKRAVIFQQTEPCKYVIFIVRGITASVYSYDGKEVITRFFQKGNFSSNIVSAEEKSIASDSLIAITDIEYYLIPFVKFIELYLHSYTFGLFIWKKLIENSIENKKITTIKTINETEIRYQFLEKHYPLLIKETPAIYLAKFLGITSEGFSRFLSNRFKYYPTSIFLKNLRRNFVF
ncbi:Crp/Fnr family transcriptional regulator [Marinifilum caeruleilacunae]|uniref:Crp/Fnr family transcriptional regulator n=1 Tax=Marinifilum caeruleilacunae TaxID=2499076 RepID=A0ABX1X138_9BACT|nr:cyclic nucleotide-binding domain-containing protein [Marinifilum caeruleilacunae]NOU62127.1 Crp/Fnr family transcriptional regulator [Marinifilum caeruleilacunae]